MVQILAMTFFMVRVGLCVASQAPLSDAALAAEDACWAEDDCGLDLRQLRASRSSLSEQGDALGAAVAGASEEAAFEKAATCTQLQNHGTFSSATVEVGTPPQSFKLVADTGSDNVIVQSCVCKDSGFCPEDFGKCFKGGSGKSSTFSLVEGPDGPLGSVMAFGSGQILVVKASDQVTVGAESAYMNGSLLLMVKQALRISGSLLLMVKQALRISGQFEGILGLGRPHRNHSNSTRFVEGFLQAAGVHRFSMCFNDGAAGVLGLNVRSRSFPLQSVGSLHWGLDFQGISVGGSQQSVTFCSPESKKPGMQSACGIIPDSGTTLIMGPEAQVESLYEELCTKWERCKKMHQALVAELEKLREKGSTEILMTETSADGRAVVDSDEIYRRIRALLQAGAPLEDGAATPALPERAESADEATGHGDVAEPGENPRQIKMSSTFLLLLKNCYTWLGNETRLDAEMPSLFFHVAGSAGGKDTLEMQPNSWVFQMKAHIAHKLTKKLLGYLPFSVTSVTTELVCTPAFGTMEYPTQLNGLIWIMGTPLFYQYQVHYDRAPDPPTMNFVREPCGACVGGEYRSRASLLEAKDGSRLREITSEPVVKEMDTTLPL